MERRTVLTLVFALVVYVVKVSKHLEGGGVGARVVDDTLATMLDEILEQL